MGCLFVLAILFAIPSYGLSLLAFVAYVIINGVLKANARMRRADQKQASRAAYTAKPVTSSIGQSGSRDTARGEAFWERVLQRVEERGIPALYANSLIAIPGTGEEFKAHVLETVGANGTVLEKEIAFADLLEMAWDRLPYEQKGPIREYAAQGIRFIDFDDPNFQQYS